VGAASIEGYEGGLGAPMATEGLAQGLKLADPPEVVGVLLVGVAGVPKRLGAKDGAPAEGLPRPPLLAPKPLY